MMQWPAYRLSRLAEKFISGGTPDTKIEEYWHGDIPWITGADFTDGEIILGRRYINQEAIKNSATNIVPKDSIIMVTRTGVGKISIAKKDIAVSQDITGIVLKKDVDPNYVIAAVKNKMALLLSAQRGATIKGITRKDIANLKLTLPPLSEQRRIVEILDQADRLRKLRAEANKKAERILPALFIKMFGDPSTNPMGWKTIKLSEAINEVKNGITRRRKTERNEGDIVLRLKEIRGNVILFEELNRIALDAKEKKKYKVSEGDLLFIRVNGNREYVGRCAVFEGYEEPVYFNDHVMRVRTDFKIINPIYLSFFLNMPVGKQEIYRGCKTSAGQYTINQQGLGMVELPLPRIEKQNKFAELFKKHRKVGWHAQTGSALLTKTFNTLLHRAFTGDLTASWRQAHMKELLQEMELQAKALNN